jgi:hypothetical protein
MFETPYPVLTIRQRHILTIAAVGRLAPCPVDTRTAREIVGRGFADQDTHPNT